MLKIIIYGIIALNVLSSLANIFLIDEPREPITKTQAFVGLIICGLYVWLWITVLGEL